VSDADDDEALMRQARRRGVPQRIKTGLVQYFDRVAGLTRDEIVEVTGLSSQEIQEAMAKPNILGPPLEIEELERRAKEIVARLRRER
jgi:hypothetical protein